MAKPPLMWARGPSVGRGGDSLIGASLLRPELWFQASGRPGAGLGSVAIHIQEFRAWKVVPGSTLSAVVPG